jgi:hypothetical protein
MTVISIKLQDTSFLQRSQSTSASAMSKDAKEIGGFSTGEEFTTISLDDTLRMPRGRVRVIENKDVTDLGGLLTEWFDDYFEGLKTYTV